MPRKSSVECSHCGDRMVVKRTDSRTWPIKQSRKCVSCGRYVTTYILNAGQWKVAKKALSEAGL